jgi:hypothetical protein
MKMLRFQMLLPFTGHFRNLLAKLCIETSSIILLHSGLLNTSSRERRGWRVRTYKVITSIENMVLLLSLPQPFDGQKLQIGKPWSNIGRPGLSS